MAILVLPYHASAMARNLTVQALVLRGRNMGEIHRLVTLFTAELGIVQAIAYGANRTKSRLRPVTISFVELQAYLYHDPVRDSYKVVDLVACREFVSIRGSVIKFYTASLMAEVAVAGRGGGGDSPRLLSLILEGLSLLDLSAEELATPLAVQFLWRYLWLAGLQPELDRCAACGVTLSPQQPMVLSPHDGASRCSRCADHDSWVLSPEDRRYLAASANLPLAAATAVQSSGLVPLKRVLYRLTELALDTRLRSVSVGAGIL